MPVRVLIADDERPIRLLCRVNLELEAMHVVEAADGVAERLRAEPATERVAIVFLTAMTNEESQDRAREWNGLFVPKPFNPLELAAIVQHAFENRIESCSRRPISARV